METLTTLMLWSYRKLLVITYLDQEWMLSLLSVYGKYLVIVIILIMIVCLRSSIQPFSFTSDLFQQSKNQAKPPTLNAHPPSVSILIPVERSKYSGSPDYQARPAKQLRFKVDENDEPFKEICYI